MACNATVTGCVWMPLYGKTICIRPASIESFRLSLTRDTSWKIGIDQSTSCTGIALKSTDNKFVILLDVHNDYRIDKQGYYRGLKYLLRRIVRDRDFRFIVNEKPIPSKNKRYARDVLMEFLGHLNEWIDDTPELRGIRHEALYPQTWKSIVVDKSKGKHRSNIKYEVASDVVDLYPGLRGYFDTYPFSDYDSFDALGILDGFEKYAFDKSGNEMIHGSIEKRHNSFVCYDWVDRAAIGENIEKRLGELLPCLKLRALVYNERYDFYTNVRMASSNYDAVITMLPDCELQKFQWRYNFDLQDKSKCLLAYVFRPGAMPRSMVSGLERIFEHQEVIRGE